MSCLGAAAWIAHAIGTDATGSLSVGRVAGYQKTAEDEGQAGNAHGVLLESWHFMLARAVACSISVAMP